MKPTKISDALLLWFACAVAACAGLSFAFGLLGGAIEVQQQRTEAIASILAVDARTLAQRPALERERDTLEKHLRAVALYSDRATTVAAFIRAISRVATAHHVEIRQIDERGGSATPASVAPTSASGQTSARQAPFDEIPLDVTLSGSYADLLATIRAMAAVPVNMRIGIASIERAASGAALTASLRIELQHVPDAPLPGAQRPTPVEEPANYARSD